MTHVRGHFAHNYAAAYRRSLEAGAWSVASVFIQLLLLSFPSAVAWATDDERTLLALNVNWLLVLAVFLAAWSDKLLRWTVYVVCGLTATWIVSTTTLLAPIVALVAFVLAVKFTEVLISDESAVVGGRAGHHRSAVSSSDSVPWVAAAFVICVVMKGAEALLISIATIVAVGASWVLIRSLGVVAALPPALLRARQYA